MINPMVDASASLGKAGAPAPFFLAFWGSRAVCPGGRLCGLGPSRMGATVYVGHETPRDLTSGCLIFTSRGKMIEAGNRGWQKTRGEEAGTDKEVLFIRGQFGR